MEDDVGVPQGSLCFHPFVTFRLHRFLSYKVIMKIIQPFYKISKQVWQMHKQGDRPNKKPCVKVPVI